MLKYQSFTFNPLQENTYIVWDTDSKECAVVDPGCYTVKEKNQLKEFIETNELKPTLLLNTHTHIDHILGNYFVKSTWNVKLHIHTQEQSILHAAKVFAPVYGFTNYDECEADVFIAENQTLKIGSEAIDVIFIPGHSPGHVGFIHRNSEIIFSGDVLFFESIGRTDLPGGNYHTLISSIKNELFVLPNHYQVLPGHGKPTTIGHEKMFNPFLSIG